MNYEPEKPTNDGDEIVKDEPNAEHYKIPFDSSLIDITRPLIDISHPTLGNISVLGWVGRGEYNEKIRQPALWLHPDVNDGETYNLSYEGFACHMSVGDTYLRKTEILFPGNGSIIEMQPDKKHYFNNYNCLTPNENFTIDQNNESMIMNNVSIFNANYSAGCMFNLRVSFEGLIDDDDDEVSGNVIVLCTVDIIG